MFAINKYYKIITIVSFIDLKPALIIMLRAHFFEVGLAYYSRLPIIQHVWDLHNAESPEILDYRIMFSLMVICRAKTESVT